jgi:hypothetical protein
MQDPPSASPDRDARRWARPIETHAEVCPRGDHKLIRDGRHATGCERGCARFLVEAALRNGRPPEPDLSYLGNRATAQPPELAREPLILDRFADDLHGSGLVGEARAGKILYLATTSRLLSKPVSVALKGLSSGGKSYTVESVLAFFPEDAYHAVTGGSERALVYSDEPLRHRMVVVYEAAGIAEGRPAYFIRSLLSEGRLRYETVDRTEGGLKGRVIEREGPTGLITTTTAAHLHPENETRILSVPINDSREQTEAVLLALAEEGNGRAPDLLPWLDLQDWLAEGEYEVTVPFARDLARLVPPVAVRLRRDFGLVLGLIRAHALLHRATRASDADGRIVAEVEDYAVVRDLVADLVAEGVAATVSEQTRETVEAVAALEPSFPEGVPSRALVKRLRLDKSAVSRRVRVALDAGHLINREQRDGRPHKLAPGEPLPEAVEVLPSVERLHGCTVAEVREAEAEVERLRAKLGTDPPEEGGEE